MVSSSSIDTQYTPIRIAAIALTPVPENTSTPRVPGLVNHDMKTRNSAMSTSSLSFLPSLSWKHIVVLVYPVP